MSEYGTFASDVAIMAATWAMVVHAAWLLAPTPTVTWDGRTFNVWRTGLPGIVLVVVSFAALWSGNAGLLIPLGIASGVVRSARVPDPSLVRPVAVSTFAGWVTSSLASQQSASGLVLTLMAVLVADLVFSAVRHEEPVDA